MRRRGLATLLLAACAAAGVLSAVLVASGLAAGADTTTSATTTVPTTTVTTPTTTAATTTTKTTATVPRPTTIPAGVTIAGTFVGGLSPAEAREVVTANFARPLTLVAGKHSFKVTPKELGAAAYVGDAVKRARVSPPGRNVPLAVAVPRAKVERWVRTRLAGRFDREPVDSRLMLRDLKPFLTRDTPGRKVKVVAARRAIVTALRTHKRDPIAVGFEKVNATLTRASFGDVIVIRRGSNLLNLFDGMKLMRTFGVATGQASYPTPLGRFSVVVKWRNPWWYPPASDWAKDAKPIPPGPGNPLGTRWMGLSAPAVGIHGTPDAASIGYSASHGCIRMRIPEAEWLFDHIEIGTPVFIVSA